MKSCSILDMLGAHYSRMKMVPIMNFYYLLICAFMKLNHVFSNPHKIHACPVPLVTLFFVIVSSQIAGNRLFLLIS